LNLQSSDYKAGILTSRLPSLDNINVLFRTYYCLCFAHQIGISCPVCMRIGLVDEQRGGAASLARTRALENIVETYRERHQLDVDCQMCTVDKADASPKSAIQVSLLQ